MTTKVKRSEDPMGVWSTVEPNIPKEQPTASSAVVACADRHTGVIVIADTIHPDEINKTFESKAQHDAGEIFQVLRDALPWKTYHELYHLLHADLKHEFEKT